MRGRRGAASRALSIFFGVLAGAWASTGLALVPPLSGITAIAAGGAHTCALTSGGGAKCWGDNQRGQIGDGSKYTRSAPVDVKGLASGVTAIAAGRDFTCALTSGGTVKCWGANDFGQLGDGSTRSRPLPGDVDGLGSGVVAIAAGGEHACAVTASRGVMCWGRNLYGQLGDGSTTTRLAPVDTKGLVSGTAALALGRNHSCAVATDGALKCWGLNNTGELGIDVTTNQLTPARVPGFSSFVAAAAGGALQSCLVTTFGGVKCWGYNMFGQVGDGSTTPRLTPVDASGLTHGVGAIAAGDDHSCALGTDGSVRCWGLNSSGQVGDGSTTNRSTPTLVSGLPAGTIAIASGAAHTCALGSDGGVRCWGENLWGQAGDRGDGYRLLPVDALAVPASVTTVVSSANPSNAGAPVTFTATVTGAGPGPAPAGFVVFRDGATTLASVTFSGGVASHKAVDLGGGTHAITAEYSGDGEHSGGISAALTQTVVVPGVTGTIAATPNPCDVSAAGTCAAQVTWTSSGTDRASVYVRTGMGSPVLFATGNHGSASAPWITLYGATFELHAGLLASDPMITSVVVTGAVDGFSASSAMGTIAATPNPCTLSDRTGPAARR